VNAARAQSTAELEVKNVCICCSLMHKRCLRLLHGARNHVI